MGIDLRKYGWDDVKTSDVGQPQIDFDKVKYLVNRLAPRELEYRGVIQEARHNGYICPKCGNGSGEDGTGIGIKDMGDHWGAKCFNCGEKFDNIHFLALAYKLDHQKDFPEICRRAYSDFGFTDCEYSTAAPKSHEEKQADNPADDSIEEREKFYTQWLIDNKTSDVVKSSRKNNNDFTNSDTSILSARVGQVNERTDIFMSTDTTVTNATIHTPCTKDKKSSGASVKSCTGASGFDAPPMHRAEKKMKEGFYTADEVAEILNVNKSTVTRWRQKKIFGEDILDHKGVYWYSAERVEQLKSVYHKGWGNIYRNNVRADDSASNEELLKQIHKDIAESRAELAQLQENHLKEGTEINFRGLTYDTLKYFGCGYLSRWAHPKSYIGDNNVPRTQTRRVIIPTANHYVAVLVPDDRKPENKPYWKMHAGKKEIFGAEFLPTNSELILVVEGEIDAMSIWQVTQGKVSVIAVGGAAEYRKAVSVLKSKFADENARPRILILYDSDETGKFNAPKLRDELLNNQFLAVCKFLSGEDSKIDANEILQKQGGEELARIVDEIIKDAESDFAAVKEDIRKRLEEQERIKEELAKASAATVSDFKMSEELHNRIYYSGTADFDNAERIAALSENKLRYVIDLERWAFYDKGVWKLAPSGANNVVFEVAERVSRIILANARNDSEKRRAYPFRIHKKLSPACSMLKGISSIRIPSKEFDQKPTLLNVANGVIDLKTGELLAHSPEYYLTKCCPVIYDPTYRSATFDNFIKSILPDEMTRRTVLQYLGYCLLGDVREEKALFIVGGGRNGKGTLLRPVMTLFGEYATALKVDSLLARRFDRDGDAPTPEFSKLEGRRLAVANEVPADRYLDVAHFKEFTGGDQVAVRALYQESRTIKNPTWHLILCGQHAPKIRDANDVGLEERLMVVHFDQTFTGDDCDPQLKYKLLEPEALTGLLTVLVEECIAYQKEGKLIVSDAMKATKQKYFDANNFIQEFISEHCVFGEDKSCSRVAMLKALKFNFRDECTGIGDGELKNMILRQLKGKPCKYKHSKSGCRFYGIALRETSGEDTGQEKTFEEEVPVGEENQQDFDGDVPDSFQDDGYKIPDDD